MKFCDKCGSYMKKVKNGFVCRKCGKKVHVSGRLKILKKIKQSNSIYIKDHSEDENVKISRVCPKCGNEEAFRWFSRVSGEHAGIRRERTIEHFRCTRCFHLWTTTS